MTNIEILMYTGLTKEEAKKALDAGTMIYSNIEDIRDDLKVGFDDIDELSDDELIKEYRYDIVETNDITYYVNRIL